MEHLLSGTQELTDTVYDEPNPFVELESRILQRVVECTGGRIRGARVQASAEAVVVEGRVSSYYVKQMAIRALMVVIQSLPVPPRSVETSIGVDSAHGVALRLLADQ